MTAGIVEKPLLSIKLRQLDKSFRRDGGQAAQFFVDRNGLYSEAILGILIADSLEILAGFFVLADPGVEIANRIEDRQVFGVLFDDLFVFSNGILQLALLDKLLCRAKYLCLVEAKPKRHSKPLN